MFFGTVGTSGMCLFGVAVELSGREVGDVGNVVGMEWDTGVPQVVYLPSTPSPLSQAARVGTVRT
jgi:hypothetical protein